MSGTIKIAINGHIVGFHKVPVTIKQAFLGGLIPNFVQCGFINLAKSNVRVIKYGKRNIGFTFTAHNFFTILILYKTGAHPIDRRIGREQHSWRLKRFVGSPTETEKTAPRQPVLKSPIPRPPWQWYIRTNQNVRSSGRWGYPPSLS